MGTNVKAPSFIQIERVDQVQSQIYPSEALRAAHYNFLSEVSGLIFGLITLCWIISSLCALT
jgi:hypothetical protein